MEKRTTELLSSLDYVLDFSSKLIVQSLQVEKPDDSEIEHVRKCCEKLSKEGVYEFKTECSDQELFKQIQEFAIRVNG